MGAPGQGSGRAGGFVRWIGMNVGAAVPQSMAPITFGFATLEQGTPNGGAWMIMAMVTAQVLGAVPVTAAGRRLAISSYIRLLAAFRALAFIALAAAIGLHAPIVVLSAVAAVTGVATGAIFGLLRATLNDMVVAKKLPRALGIAATANELVFVAGPVLASLMGGISAAIGVAVMALASALPLVLLPRIAHGAPERPIRDRREAMPARTLVWLLASTSSSACVASIEVGALALALRYHFPPADAVFFTVPLCLASVAGGTWISFRNRRLRRSTLVVALLAMSGAAIAIASSGNAGVAIAAAVTIGLFLAPLGTSYSLVLDDVLPRSRRAEGFALLRTSNALGVIVVSGVIALSSPGVSFAVAAVLALLSAILIGAYGMPPRREALQPTSS